MPNRSLRSRPFRSHVLVVPLLAMFALAACQQQEHEASSPAGQPASTPASDASNAPAPAPADAATGDATANAGADAGTNAPAAAAAPAAVTPVPQIEPIKFTPQMADAGKKLFFSAGCNACHGGTGGGGMCPPLTNDIWVYGNDVSTLHALIKEGSAAMQTAHGLKRVGTEKVVGIMPPFGSVLSDDEINQLIAFIHSLNPGVQEKAGAPAAK